MKQLAPIALFVYNRPHHTEITLNALSKNILADKSELFIFCDGPKAESNKQKKSIEDVRSIVKSKKWCNKVHIIEQNENFGLAKSIRSGINSILNDFNNIIVMEDDLKTSPAFLTYLNKALEYYQEYKSVFSISAFNFPEKTMPIPLDYQYDVYTSRRNGSWGWATWKDRWQKIDWDCKSYPTIKQNIEMKNAFNRGGDDMFNMLEMQQSGKLDIWSIQFTLAHFVNNSISIVPTVSYVDNIGLDGTGENCGIHNNLSNNTLNTKENIQFLDILYEDKRLINAFYNVNCHKKRPLCKKIINRLSRFLTGKNVYTIKRKVFC